MQIHTSGVPLVDSEICDVGIEERTKKYAEIMKQVDTTPRSIALRLPFRGIPSFDIRVEELS